MTASFTIRATELPAGPLTSQAAHGRQVPSGNGLGREVVYAAVGESCQTLIHFESFINRMWDLDQGNRVKKQVTNA
jgi:hypothetical protein